MRDDLVALDPVEKARDERVPHRLVRELDAEQSRRIGDDGVAGVEDAQLHGLVGGNVRHELHAGPLQGRAPGGEIVLEHPLDEILGEDGPAIRHPVLLAHQPPLPLAGGGG